MGSGFADVFDELFGKIIKPQGCDACQTKTLAFGVRVCRLGKPEPKTGATCAFWEKLK